MALVRIEGTPREIKYVNGEKWIVVDLQVSTAADLPDLGDDVCGAGKLGAGSTAQIVQAGTIKTLDDDGDWYAWGGGTE